MAAGREEGEVSYFDYLDLNNDTELVRKFPKCLCSEETLILMYSEGSKRPPFPSIPSEEKKKSQQIKKMF